MSDRRLFDRDPVLGITEFFHWDEASDTFHIEAVQDVEPAIEANKQSFNSYTSPRDSWGAMHRVASVPLVIYQEWMKTGAHRDQGFLRRWLNDPENRFFRTRPGRV
jgi:hypothetical protein